MRILKNIKKNQIVIYVVALMFVVAAYLNYGSQNIEGSIQTLAREDEIEKTNNIGDAQLVSSVAINGQMEDVEINKNDINANDLVENETIETSIQNIENKNYEYFSKSKLERDAMYSQMIETYQKVLDSSNSLETQRKSAQEEITKINNLKNSVMICENLIKIKGFENCIVFANGDSISVIVEDEQLSPEEVSQIQNIISRELNAKVENIHISSK